MPPTSSPLAAHPVGPTLAADPYSPSPACTGISPVVTGAKRPFRARPDTTDAVAARDETLDATLPVVDPALATRWQERLQLRVAGTAAIEEWLRVRLQERGGPGTVLVPTHSAALVAITGGNPALGEIVTRPTSLRPAAASRYRELKSTLSGQWLSISRVPVDIRVECLFFREDAPSYAAARGWKAVWATTARVRASVGRLEFEWDALLATNVGA